MGLVEYAERDGICHITLNRPEVLNALSDDMILELKDCLFRFDDDTNANVGILAGNGRAFCTGGDVKQRQLKPIEEIKRLGSTQSRDSRIEDLMYRFTNWKPMIAALHGYVMGAGLYLALMCEMAVAEVGTKFQITETSRGVDATRFWSLLRDRASAGFASDVAITGRYWLADEAVERGAIDRVTPKGKHRSVAEELAKTIMANPPLSVRATTETRRGVNEQIELQARLTKRRDLHLTADFRESALAFVEKRKPVFRGE